MSTISAGTAPGTALVTSGDTTGQLVLQTNGTTTAVTIGTNQVVSLAQPLPVASGGTGATSLSAAGILTTGAAVTVAQGGTGSTSLTANNVLLGNGTSAVQFVAPGTNGNVLTSNGTTWQSTAPAGGGSMIFLSSVTASNSATVNIETGIGSTYDYYMITFTGITPNSDSILSARLRINGTYQTASYKGTTIYASTDSASVTVDRPTDSFSIVRYSVGNAAGRSAQGFFMFGSPTSTSLYKSATWNATGFSPTGFGSDITSSNFGGGFYVGGTQALTGVQFYFNSGNIASGTFRLYGIKNS